MLLPYTHTFEKRNLLDGLLQPDILACRGSVPLLPETKEKLGMHCQVGEDAVISIHDVTNVYRIPQLMCDQGVVNLLIKKLHLVWKMPARLPIWNAIAEKMDAAAQSGICSIALVGKYCTLSGAC